MSILKRLAVLIAIAVAVVGSAGPLRAQLAAPSQEALTAAAELLGALGMEKQFEAVLPLLMQQMRSLILQANPQADKELDAALPVIIEKFGARKGEIVPLVAQIYARRISIPDMKAMTAFFKSAAGQRFIQVQPQLTRESMAIGQEWGRRIGVEVDRELRQELRKRGITL